MLKYPCLVLDHDDTVVQTEKTIGYPYFCYILDQFRPGQTIDFSDYVHDCHNYGFAEMCRRRWQFTPQELKAEYEGWMDYVMTHIPEIFPGIDRIIRRQKEEGGLICVVSHSSTRNITRDYRHHFGMLPDAIYGWELPPHQRKPNPWPLEDIMSRFALKPEDILVIDDMKLACLMAAPLGVKVCYAGWSGMGIQSLSYEMYHLCAFGFDTTDEMYRFLFEG
jgi:phosphoglycolate phosphatase/pyrophosphatase PpaX